MYINLHSSLPLQGVGGYGRLGAALSGGECVMAHRNHRGRPNMCSDALAKIKV